MSIDIPNAFLRLKPPISDGVTASIPAQIHGIPARAFLKTSEYALFGLNIFGLALRINFEMGKISTDNE